MIAMNGLADATYNDSTYTITTPQNRVTALQAAKAMWQSQLKGGVGYWGDVEQFRVFKVGDAYYAVSRMSAALGSAAGNLPTPLSFQQEEVGEPRQRIGLPAVYRVWRLVPKGTTGAKSPITGAPISKTEKKTTNAGDCPPAENCQERTVQKTLYVSARPVSGAIEIPVAYERLVCEGDSPEPPEIDCDDLLKALKQSVDQGGVPGFETMNGLGFAMPTQMTMAAETPLQAMAPPQLPVVPSPSMPPAQMAVIGSGNFGGGSSRPITSPGRSTSNVPDDWCRDCTTTLVRAIAYVSDRPTSGSVPFKVGMKVIVCDAAGDPKIDCQDVVKALQAGIKAKKYSALNGLSSAMPMPNDFTLDKAAQQIEKGPYQGSTSSNKSWLPWALAGAAVVGAVMLNK